MSAVALQAATAERALRWTETLAGELGPRRPTSRAEHTAAQWLCDRLGEAGVEARLEPFPAFSSFAWSQGAVAGLSLASGTLPRAGAGGALRAGLAAAAVGLGAAEEGLRHRPVTRALARRTSHNLVATIEPGGKAERTLCLVSHIDSSRSGLLFSGAIAPRLRALSTAGSAAALAQLADATLGRRWSAARAAGALGRGVLAVALLLLAERELRGEDVPGANDNASGAAVTAALIAERSAEPLATTRLVLLVTGAEEAGTLGADAFLRSRDTSGWLFLNLDGVGAPATLRYLPREGITRTWPADAGLLHTAAALAASRPELGFAEADGMAGLTYDATPVLAGGGRALTISAQDGDRIPNYHQPSDDPAHLDPNTLARACEVGRELIAAIDRGEAD